MSQLSSRIEHEGVIEEVTLSSICVSIVSTSACETCHAKGSCAMSERTEKKVYTPNTGVEFTVGEHVKVVMSSKTGFQSVLLAYIFPLILLLSTIYIFLSVGFSEGLSAILGLLAMGLYYTLLYLIRRTLAQKLEVRIEKLA